MRDPTVAPFVAVSVICCPTIGARSLSKVETDQRVDRTVVHEAEPADLGPLRAVVANPDLRDDRHAEHADLRVRVPELRDLEVLGLALEAREPVRAEVAVDRIGVVAAVARELVVAELGEEEVVPPGLRGGQRVVERAYGIRGVGDLEQEIGERVHLLVGERSGSTHEPFERHVELDESAVGVERVAPGVVARGPVAAPVHRPAVGHPAQALRRHRALHRVEGGIAGGSEAERVRVVRHRAVRVPEIPGEPVEVRRDVAARARRVSVARGVPRVVEQGAPRDDLGGLGVVERMVGRLGLRREIDDGDPVVEPRHRVEHAVGLVEHDSRGSAGAQFDLVCLVGHERVVLQARGVEDADLARPERRDVERRAVGRHRHPLREREALVVFLLRPRERVVVDVLVEVPREDGAARENGDPAFVEVPPDGASPEDPGPLEAEVVPRLGVADVDVAALGIRHHAEQHRAHSGEGRAQRRRRRVRVDREDVVIGEREFHLRVPVPAEVVQPVSAVELRDHAGLGRGHAVGVRAGGHHPVGNRALVDRRGLVARQEDRGIDDRSVGTHGQRAGRVPEQAHDAQRRAAQAGSQVLRVEDPDVGPADGRREELRIERVVLAAVGRRDERTRPARSAEHDVGGLVADQYRPRHSRRRRAHVDDAHAVREVVDHPHLAVRAGRDGDGLHADGDRSRVREAGGTDLEDLEAAVGRVDGEQAGAVRRHRERPHLRRLERDEARARRRRLRRGAPDGDQRADRESGQRKQCEQNPTRPQETLPTRHGFPPLLATLTRPRSQSLVGWWRPTECLYDNILPKPLGREFHLKTALPCWSPWDCVGTLIRRLCCASKSDPP